LDKSIAIKHHHMVKQSNIEELRRAIFEASQNGTLKYLGVDIIYKGDDIIERIDEKHEDIEKLDK